MMHLLLRLADLNIFRRHERDENFLRNTRTLHRPQQCIFETTHFPANSLSMLITEVLHANILRTNPWPRSEGEHVLVCYCPCKAQR